MVAGLLELLKTIFIVAIFAGILLAIVELIPMFAPYRMIVRWVVLGIVAIVILVQFWPILVGALT